MLRRGTRSKTRFVPLSPELFQSLLRRRYFKGHAKATVVGENGFTLDRPADQPGDSKGDCFDLPGIRGASGDIYNISALVLRGHETNEPVRTVTGKEQLQLRDF